MPLTLPDGRRINANLLVVLHHGKAGTVREYQFVQFSAAASSCGCCGPGVERRPEPALRAEVREALGIDVTLRKVDRFERRGRGKHRDS